MTNFTPYKLTEEGVKLLAISDAVDTRNLGADRTQSDEVLLIWESTKAYMRGVRKGYALGAGLQVFKPWYKRLWDKI